MTPAERRRAILALLRSSLRGRGREMRSLVAWSAVQAVPAFLSGRLVAQALDDGFLVGRTWSGLALLALLGAAMLVGAWGARQAYRRLATIVEPFRDELVEVAARGAISRAVLPGAPTEAGGVARLAQHVEIAREAYASVLMVVQSFLATTVSALLGLLSLDPEVLLVVLPPLLLGLAVFLGVLVRTAARQRASILADEHIAEVTSSVASGMRDIAGCGGEPTVAAAVAARIKEQAEATRAIARCTSLQTLAIALGGWVPVVLIVAAGPWLTRNGATTGTILGALTYMLQGVHPALQTLVRGLGSNGMWLVVTLERVVEASATPEVPDRGPGPAARDRPGLLLVEPDQLTLRTVTFRYGPYAAPVVDDLTLDVPAGDHLAVVGPSGVGKSTLAGLMTGVLEPQAGAVLIGGVPIAELDATALARSRVLIPQESYVFTGSLWENLTYLAPTATTADVDAAVEQLGLGSLVERLGGYESEVQPSALSAGERQLVALVRAFTSPAPIVILDEATCHLDPAAEALAEQAFARRPGTLVVIAHRISSAQRARRILVMDGTRSVLGTHGSLLHDVALYRDLVGYWQSTPIPDPV